MSCDSIRSNSCMSRSRSRVRSVGNLRPRVSSSLFLSATSASRWTTSCSSRLICLLLEASDACSRCRTRLRWNARRPTRRTRDMHTIPPARVCSTPIKTPATARPIRADAHRTDPGIEEEDPSAPSLVWFSSCNLTAASRSRACSRSRSLSSHCRIGGAMPGSTSVAEEAPSTDVCKLRTASRIFSSFCAERDRSCCAYRTSCSTNAIRRDQERSSSSISPPVGTARIRSRSHSTQSVFCFCFAVSVERRAAFSTSV